MRTSYEGCPPEIAQSLAKGEHITAYVKNDLTKAWENEARVVAYMQWASYPFITLGSGNFRYATVKRTETRYIGIEAMVKELLKRGYRPQKDGNWSKLYSPEIPSDTLFLCGSAAPEYSDFQEWMVEEVEI